MNILKKYNKQLSRRGYNGPINFHQEFRLGHILTFDSRSGFEVVGHIADSKFKFKNYQAKEVKGASVADIDFGSESGVDIDMKIKGSAPIAGSKLNTNDAGLIIEFDKSASYILKTEGTKVDYIENIAALGDEVKRLYKEAKWNRNWFIVTQLVNAQRTTLIISRSSESKIELKAEGAVKSVSENDLVSAKVDFSVMSKKNMSTNVIGKRGPYYPLFKVNGIRVRRLFGGNIGSEFEAMSTINPMNSFTISDLKDKNSGFELFFEPHDFEDELRLED